MVAIDLLTIELPGIGLNFFKLHPNIATIFFQPQWVDPGLQNHWLLASKHGTILQGMLPTFGTRG